MGMDPRNLFAKAALNSIPGPSTQVDDDDFDFGDSAKECSLTPFAGQPAYKNFFLQVEGVTGMVQATRFAKTELSKLYEKISKTLLLEEGSFIIKYKLKRLSGKSEEITFKYNADKDVFKETQELLYCQARQNDTLTIVRVKKEGTKEFARKKKKSENLFKEFKRLIGSSNKKAYQILLEGDVIETFVQKLTFVRVLLGDKSACNLLNPVHFSCPHCTKVVVLKAFNNDSNITRHLINHKLANNKLCSTLYDRYTFLNNKWFIDNVQDKTTNEMISTIEELKPELSLKGLKCFIVKPGLKFKGSSYLVDEEIIRQVSVHDFSGVDNIKDQCSILSHFGKKKKKIQCNANINNENRENEQLTSEPTPENEIDMSILLSDEE